MKKTPWTIWSALLLSALLSCHAVSNAAGTAAAAPAPKVLRYAFRIAETGFDPVLLNDIYSRAITAHIFEGLYGYDPLARPAKIKPLTAAALPQSSADFKVWTVHLKPGIYFADDPAFKGKKRELTAADYVYSLKRFADPGHKSPAWGDLESYEILGLNSYRRELVASKKPFNYEHEIEGIKALDRYTLQFKLAQARPRFVGLLAQGTLYGAVAREVVEAYGEAISAHPVGTGPFVLKSWRRSSLIVLERNPGYRERFYDAEPNADDTEGQALLARFKGRRLPMVDRVEVSIINENQPRWLSFLNGEYDFIERLPEDFITQAMPLGHLAPNLAKRGLQAYRTLVSDLTYTMFNMDDPVVGGYTPEKVALRRALSLATDIEREIRLVRRGQGIPAQSVIVPNTSGYAPQFKSESSEYDVARAKALLDLYGYIDRDGDGWRELPNGQPLTLLRLTQADNASRQLDEIWQKNLKAIGIKIEFKTAQWPENMKAVRAGKYQIWGLASSASTPDGQDLLALMHGEQIGGQNMARFNRPEFDRIYERLSALPDGPEREALFLQAKRIATAYLPYKAHAHRLVTDMAMPYLIGYRRPLFWLDWWEYVDIDESRRPH
jgi:ABC-type transport system substrate-binding protein